MLYDNKSALKTPIINKVVYLNKQLAYYGRLLPHGRNRKNAYKLQCSFNSYVGFMCHCRSYNIQNMLMQMILDSDYKQWLYFENRKGRLICEVKNEYKPKNIRIKELHEIREHQKLYEYEYRSKSKCSAKQRAA